MSWAAARRECIAAATREEHGRVACFCAECGIDVLVVTGIRAQIRAYRFPPRNWRPGPRLRSWQVDQARWFEDQMGWRAPERSFGEVHHITPRAEGGSNEQSNLRHLCQWCHSKYTRAYARDRGDRRRRSRRLKMGEQRVPHVRLKMGERKPRRW